MTVIPYWPNTFGVETHTLVAELLASNVFTLAAIANIKCVLLGTKCNLAVQHNHGMSLAELVDTVQSPLTCPRGERKPQALS